MRKPNILFYFTDQQRYDTCGCYGQKFDITPRLDSFAKNATLFLNAFTCQPVCGPARATLQSGRWSADIGCHINGISLPRNIPTLAGTLSKAGYQTAYCGKWHLASDNDGEDNRIGPIPEYMRGGWKDYWCASDVLEFTSHGYGGYMYNGDGSKYSFTDYRTDAVTRPAIDFLRNHRDTEKPFILFVSHIEPHHQNDHDCYEGPEGSKERYKGYEVPGDLVGTGGNWRENYPDYLGCCNKCDENFGKLLDTLEETNELENTVIIYTADHGSHFCTRNAEYKRSCHDGCTHIPLVIGGPGFAGGKVCERMVSLIDLPYTILSVAGAEPFDNMAGRDLHSALDGSEWEDTIYMQISESHVGRAIRTHKWKYAIGAPDADALKDAYGRMYVETYLYDLEADPYEKINLVDDPAYADVRENLREVMKEQMRKANEPAFEIRAICDKDYLAKISKPGR